MSGKRTARYERKGNWGPVYGRSPAHPEAPQNRSGISPQGLTGRQGDEHPDALTQYPCIGYADFDPKHVYQGEEEGE